MEIFKTNNCGWGVRAPVDVERGKVLGIYTGYVLSSDSSSNNTTEQWSFYIAGF